MTQSPSPESPARKTLADHRALHGLLDEIERASADAASAAEQLPSRLDTLHERLAQHFEDEESSGLFEQIQELAPEQAHECKKLCDEHLGLLKKVDDPERFGVAEVEGDRVLRVVEKPAHPPSNLAVTGCYFYDKRVFEIIRGLGRSERGELEITDVNNRYIEWGA